MYRDIITNQNIPGKFTLLNGIYEKYFDIIFHSILNILTQNNVYVLPVEVVVPDINSFKKIVKKYFPNTLHISCYFHYMKDIFRNLKQ